MRILWALLLLGLTTSCASVPASRRQAIWLKHGRVWTGDPESPQAQALLVSANGRILAVGSDDAVAERAAGIGAREYDLHGRTVVPGFIDAHVHILSGGLALDRVDVHTARSREETLRMVADYAYAHPDRPWILGRGWSYDLWKPGFPTRQELDRVVPDRPVWLRSYDGHSAWANSKALAAAGVDEKTPDIDPSKGRIVREPGSQKPQGVFLEDAMDAVGDKVPRPTVEERKSAIRAALAHAAARGVTALCEVGDSLENFSVYQSLDRDHQLPVRVVYGPAITDGIEAYAAARARFLKERPEDSMLSPGPLKGFVDGVVESNTAYLLKPYADGSGKGAPPHLSAATILQQVRAADRLGIDTAYHSVGDGSVRSVLNAIEEVERTEKPRERRDRIEHIEVITKKDIPRFAKLGAIASMMPEHADPSDELEGGVWSAKVGPERLHRAFAFRSLEKAHARLAFGSDWPIVPIDPLPALAVAVTRQTPDGRPPGGWVPEQKISMNSALTGYTAGAAYATRLDDRVGVLKPGMDGDLAVLSADADLDHPASLFKAQVDLTLSAGRVVYERK
jgi:predicted amidohydrolase YtcJ